MDSGPQHLHKRAAPASTEQNNGRETEAKRASAEEANGCDRSFDACLGHWFFRQTQSRRHTLKLLLEIGSLSGDELVWLAPPCIFITLAMALRMWFAAYAALTQQGWTEIGQALFSRAFWEDGQSNLMGTVSVAICIEMIVKLIFRRPRPWYSKQSSTYVIPGEKYSMPSGHVLRTATLAFWLARDADALGMLAEVGLVSGAGGSPVASSTWLLLVTWVVLVMLARVGLGKHYPLDVVAGAVLGICSGWFLTSWPRYVVCWAKTVGGTIATACWGGYYFVPELSKMTGAGRPVLMAAYLTFYTAMLFSRCDPSSF